MYQCSRAASNPRCGTAADGQLAAGEAKHRRLAAGRMGDQGPVAFSLDDAERPNVTWPGPPEVLRHIPVWHPVLAGDVACAPHALASGDPGGSMARIPTHTIENAPAAARPLLAEMIQFSPTGRLLNMHAQMAHAPAVLEAYVSIRKATARHGTLDQQVRTALMLVAAAADASPYALAIISTLALRSGWREDQVEGLLAGQDTGEDKLDALT